MKDEGFLHRAWQHLIILHPTLVSSDRKRSSAPVPVMVSDDSPSIAAPSPAVSGTPFSVTASARHLHPAVPPGPEPCADDAARRAAHGVDVASWWMVSEPSRAVARGDQPQAALRSSPGRPSARSPA